MTQSPLHFSPVRPRSIATLAFLLLTAAGLLAGGAPEARATNGARPTSMGARAAGRGGADTAVADDATAVNTNPAGLAFIDGQRFDSTTALFVPRIEWRNPVQSSKSRNPTPGGVIAGSFGVTFDLDDAWCLGEAMTFSEETFSETPSRTTPDYKGNGLKFGIGVFPLAGSFIDLDTRSPFFNDEEKPWEADIKELAVAVAIAWRPVPWLSIGISPMFVYSQLENDQPVTQPTSILQGHPFGNTGVTYSEAAPFLGVEDIEGYADLDDLRTYGFRARIGILAIPYEWEDGRLSVGLTYASQTFKQDYLGDAFVDFSRQIDTLDPNGTLLRPIVAANTGIPENEQVYAGKYNLRLGALNQPQEVSLGVALQVSRVLLSVDATWLNWSATFDEFDGKLSDGESRELNELTGDESGETRLKIPLDWDDQIVLAAGLAVAPTDWLVLRCGYNYGRNPIPADTVQPTTPAIIEHHVMLGASVHIRRVEISLAVERAFTNTIRIGDSRSNADVENSEISAGIDVIALGVSVRF